jgi:hypothetical protein
METSFANSLQDKDIQMDIMSATIHGFEKELQQKDDERNQVVDTLRSEIEATDRRMYETECVHRQEANIFHYHIHEGDRKLEEQRSFHEKEMSDMWKVLKGLRGEMKQQKRHIR